MSVAPVETNAVAGGDRWDAACAGRMVKTCLGHLQRACQALALYSDAHPAAQAAIAAAVDAINGHGIGLGALAGRVRVGVSERALQLHVGSHAETQVEVDASVELLVKRLRELGMAGVEFARPVSARAMMTLASVIQSPDSQNHSAGELADLLHERTGGEVEVVPIEYSALRTAVFGSGSGEGAVDLDRLVGAVIGGSRSALGLSEREAAALANDVVRGRGGKETARVDVETLGRALSGTAGAERAEVVGRLRTFVEGLSPELRAAFVAPATGKANSTVLTELGDLLPIERVLDAVEGLSALGGDRSRDLGRLLSKLATLAPAGSRSAERVEQLRMDEQTSSQQRTATSDGTQEFSPEAYQQRLDALAGRGGGRVSLSAEHAREWALTTERRVEIAVDLLETPGGAGAAAQDLPGLFACVAGALTELARAGRWSLIVRAARVAERDKGPGSAAGPRGASAVFSAALQTHGEELGKALNGEVSIDAAVLVLKMAGERGIAGAIREYARMPSERGRMVVGRLLNEASVECAAILGVLGTADIAALLEFLRFAVEVRAAGVIGVIEQLAQDPRADVRRAAILACSGLEHAWPSVVVQRALIEDDLTVQSAALRSVSKPGNQQAVALVASFLEGRAVRKPSRAAFDVGVAAMAEARAGEVSVACLCEVVRALAMRPGRESAWRAAAVARALKPFHGNRVVRETLTLGRRLLISARCRAAGKDLEAS